MTSNLISNLQTYFGFNNFRPGQQEAIRNLLDNQNTLVVMPTGAGKSLIFQLAALELPGVTLVISPLIALMKDQVDSLERRGISATFINSTLPGGEQSQRLKDLASGRYRIVCVAPERLRSTHFLNALKCHKIGLLAVDEAHCISEWGYDFRPDYLHIGQFRTVLGNPLTAALTATATLKVQDDIARSLGISQIRRVVTGFNRPNLALEVRYKQDQIARLKVLQEKLANLKDGATIIYTGTRRDAEEIGEFINTVVGIRAQHYHAGLPSEERARIQDEFMTGDLSVVAATNAFGMGIDRPDVRQVIHYSLPGSLEAYYQEAGRAGRDGLPARAVLLYAPKDRALQEWFIENSVITIKDLHLLFKVLKPVSAKQQAITRDDLSRLTGLQEVKVGVGLSELERAGVLEHLGDEGMHMWIKLHVWKDLDIQAVTHRLEQHQAYRKAQLNCMIAYAESNKCRRRIILEHFGDVGRAEAEVCCDNCLARQPVLSTVKPADALSQSDRVALIVLDAVRRLPHSVGKEKIVKILRGSREKDIEQFGYEKTTYYGSLAGYSSSEVKQVVGQLIGMGYFKLIGSKYPVISLTPQGEAAVRDKAVIDLKLTRQIDSQEIEHKKAESQAGCSVELTEQLEEKSLAPQMTSRSFPEPSIQHIVALGNSKSTSVVPELVKYLQSQNGNIRRLAASALGKIADKRATLALMELLSKEEKPQVRQYAVKALGEIGDLSASFLLDAIAQDEREKEYTREAARCAMNKLPSGERLQNSWIDSAQSHTLSEDPVIAFLSHSHPRPLPGPWQVGWALGFHSQFSGADRHRTQTGELAYRLKYQSDLSVLPELIEQTVALIADRPELIQVDAIVPVPPSTARSTDPVSSFAKALAQRLDLAFWPVLAKSRKTEPQKEMHTLAQKRSNTAGAFNLQSPIHGKRILIVDDLFDFGATLEEITRLFERAGATQVNVLTLTRTIHSDA